VTLQDLSNLSQTVGAVAILASLAAVYWQVRQTNAIARAQISQNVAATYASTLRELMQPELAAIFRKVMFDRAELSPVETTQILVYFNLTVSALRDLFIAVRAGIVDERMLDSLSQNVCWYLTAPAFAREWRRVQQIDLYGQEFVAYVHARFAKLHPGPALAMNAPGPAEREPLP
jgi:hypothetical protein